MSTGMLGNRNSDSLHHHGVKDFSIAFIVHSFNRVGNIDQIASGLPRFADYELIVCDDGSLDGSRRKWESLLVRPNEFLILSNDLHEIRILDRAIRMASSDLVCLIQDDDEIPAEPREWLDPAILAFRRHPKLVILGGFMGFNGFHVSPIEARDSAIWGETDFRFVAHVNIGPYFIRRQAYLALGGWDRKFSAPGEPGIGFDSELCLRAWISGYEVGYRFIPFKGPPMHYSLDGGTMLFGKEVRFRNQWRNHRLIAEMYRHKLPEIARWVHEANRRLG
jgi:glycosyltransferase involved in cell wall biosynthesis